MKTLFWVGSLAVLAGGCVGGRAATPAALCDAPASSSTTLTRRDLDRGGTGRLDGMLEGRIPGVDVATVGGRSVIRIRGASSFNRAEPLVVIDGMPAGVGAAGADALAALDARDVESVEVIKDGAGAARYGLRGGGGVIVVKLRRGGCD